MAALIKKIAIITIGLFLTVIGVILLFVPGPGTVLIIFGVGLIATEIPIVKELLNNLILAYNKTKFSEKYPLKQFKSRKSK